LAGRYDVVGFTTTFAQLFASLAVARELRRLDPSVKVVLGGAGVSFEAGPSVLAEYPFVDHVIQGDGEAQLLELLDRLDGPAPAAPKALAVLGSRPAASAAPASLYLSDLDRLPAPDFDRYPELAAQGE